jgi:hypothetical protein
MFFMTALFPASTWFWLPVSFSLVHFFSVQSLCVIHETYIVECVVWSWHIPEALLAGSVQGGMTVVV